MIKLIETDRIADLQAKVAPAALFTRLISSSFVAGLPISLLYAVYLDVVDIGLLWNTLSFGESLTGATFLMLSYIGVWRAAYGAHRHDRFAIIGFLFAYFAASLGILYFLARQIAIVLIASNSSIFFLSLLLFSCLLQLSLAFVFLRSVRAIISHTRAELDLSSNAPSGIGSENIHWVEIFGAPAVIRRAKGVGSISLYALSSVVLGSWLYPILLTPFVTTMIIDGIRQTCSYYFSIGFPELIEACISTEVVSITPGFFAYFLISVIALGLFLLLRFCAERLIIRHLREASRNSFERNTVYLRSFGEDLVKIDRKRRGALSRLLYATDILRPSLDFMLSQLLMHQGPVVSLGKPGQTMAPFGTQKIYLPENDWKQEVCRLISESVRIVICLDTSDGVKWELDEIFASRSDTKALFLLSPENICVGRSSASFSVLCSAAHTFSSPLEKHFLDLVPLIDSKRIIGFFYDYSSDSLVAFEAREPLWENYAVMVKAFNRKGDIHLCSRSTQVHHAVVA